jgi:heptosyltransferase II
LPRILVVAPNWIGDALMAQPLLTRLHEKLPGARIEVLAPPWVGPVARRMPEVAEVIDAPLRHGPLQLRSRWRLGRSLGERRYDQAIVLPNSWKSALVPFFADIPLRSGYVGESRYGLLNLLYKNTQAPMGLHYARLAEAPGTEPRQPLPQPRLQVSAEEIAAVKARFRLPDGYTVLCPGAEYGPAKRWPYFAELSKRLGAPAVALGAAGDVASAQGIKGTNLVGKTSLDEALALIAGARSVVSNDSGLMHVAAALGRPLVALFGSSSPEHTPPASAAARVLWLRVECSPCHQRECPLGHFKCMKDMDVEMVLHQLEAVA